MNTVHTHKFFKFNLHCLTITHFLFLIGLILSPLTVSAQSSTSTARTPGAPAGSYKLSDDDSINLFTGNLNYNLPLLSIGGRGEVQSNLSVAIEKQWDVKRIDIGDGYYQHEYNSYDPYNSFVGSVKFDRTIIQTDEPCDDNANRWVEYTVSISYVEANGTEHTFRDRQEHGKPFRICGGSGGGNLGNIFESTSGDNIVFVTDSNIYGFCYNIPNCTNRMDGYLYFKNGVKARVTAGGVGFIGYIDWIKDRNGNTIQYDYEDDPNLTGGKRILKITDTLGREVNFAYDVNEGAPYGICTKISYDGFGGGQQNKRIIRISHDTDLSHLLRTTQSYDSTSPILVTYDDPNDNVYITGNQVSTNFVKAVWLPDGRSYQFKYNVLGQLARIDLPTGGAFEYDFADVAQLPFEGPPNQGTEPKITNRVSEKRIYDSNNVLLNKTTFSNPTTYTSGVIPGNRGGTVRDVEQFDSGSHRLEKSRHYFYGAPDARYGITAPWWHGKEFRTEVFDSNGTSILRVNEQDWRQRIPSWCSTSWPCSYNPTEVSPTNSPFVVETRTTLSDSNLVMKTTSVNPSTGEWAFDAYNNQTDVWEYDFGNGQPGAFKRRTHTDFVTDTNYTSYTGAYLLSLPSQIWTSSDIDGTTKASLTQVEYDNYTGSNNAALLSRASVVGHDTTNYGTNNTIRGNVTKATTYGNAQNQTGAISVYSNYDILGNVVKTYDAKGNSTDTSYNDNFGAANGEARSNSAPTQLNGLSTFAFPTSGTNALGWIVGYTQFDYFTGQPVNTEDINGVISKTLYNDPLDRPTQSVTAVGTAFERQSNIIYDDANHRVETKSDLNALNDNLLKSESFYDGLGRAIKAVRYESDGNPIVTESIPFVMVQDPETSVWRAGMKSSNPYRPNAGEQPVWTTSLSDSLGRSIKTITPDGAIVKTAYSGNTVTVTDQAGKQRRSVTNALGQLMRVDEPNNAGQLDVSGSPAQSTGYSYDVLNNLTTVSQGAQTRTFQYDSLSRLKQAANPESGTISYVYDNNGNLSTKTDARSISTVYAYDALNRVTSRDYSDATPDALYTYDNLTNAKGKLTKVVSGILSGGAISNPFSTTEYTSFDLMGRVTGHKQTTDGQSYTTGYVYNLSGALTEETYPSGRVVKNVLDTDGDLAIVESKKNANSGYFAYAKAFTYTAAGAVSSMQLGNGRWESTQFNSRLQPVQIALGTIANGTDKLKLNFAYNTTGNADNNGNVLSQTITVPTEVRNSTTYNGFTATQSYTYDSLNRIHDASETISSTQQWKQTFSYDRFGNRTFDEANTSTLPKNCGTSPTFTVCTADRKIYNPTPNTTDNRLSTSDGYQFDSAGNTTRDANSRKFTYDGDNKQTKVETVDSNGNPISTVGEYYYDGDGKRVKKVSATEITIFVYDAGGKMVAEYSTALSQTPQVSYLTSDHLGSPRINTDQNGSVIARHDYQPFGEEITRTSYGADDVRKQFTSYERDDEIDLDFAQARYYSNQLGRFTSVDPTMASADIINPQTFNRYAYVGNNPVNITDPTGEIWGEKGGFLYWFKGDTLPGGYNPYNALVGTVAGGLVVLNGNGTTTAVANAGEALRLIIGSGVAAAAIEASAVALGYVAVAAGAAYLIYKAAEYNANHPGQTKVRACPAYNDCPVQGEADLLNPKPDYTIKMSSNEGSSSSSEDAAADSTNAEKNKPDTSANRGGGKDARKSNPDRVSSAKEREQEARAELAEIKSRPNKVKQDFIDRDKAQKKLNKALSDQSKSEPHGRKKKGS